MRYELRRKVVDEDGVEIPDEAVGITLDNKNVIAGTVDTVRYLVPVEEGEHE